MAERQIVWKSEKRNINTRQWVLNALLVSVLQLLLVWGTSQLVNNVFGLQMVTISTKFKVLMLLSTLIISFWNEWNFHKEQKKKNLMVNIILLLGLILGLWLSYGGVIEEVAEGLKALGNTYMNRWNVHSKEYRAGSFGVAVMGTAIEFLLLVVMWFMQILGGRIRKRRIALAVPVGIICMGLLVMAIPQWGNLAILLISGVLLFYVDSEDSISWKRLVVLSVASLLLISMTGGFQEEAQARMLSMNGDWFNFWENIGEDIEKKVDDFEFPEWSTDNNVIDNTSPEFEDKQVILLTMSERTTSPVYLRGYHCKNYVDGAWEKDTKSFQKACREYGIDEVEAAEKLILFQHEQEDIFDNQQVVYELSYTDIKDEYCYFPYGAGWEETPEKYELSQDYLIKKKRNEKEGKTVGWQQLNYLDADIDVSDRYSPFQEWYNEFVIENYLSVPDNQLAVKRLAYEMSRNTQFSAYIMDLNPEQSSYDEVNASRLHVAYLVAAWLKSQGTYSLELDELPTGTDAVEYFLSTSKEGFCEHFASAGTLILRELGVPARYTTGYIAKSGAMKAANGKYMTSVLDSYAHAWTEIYLDNYGWIPIEMTPGYSGSTDAMLESNPTATPESEDPIQQPEDLEPEATEAPTDVPEDAEISTDEDAEPSDDEEESQESEKDTFKPLPMIILLGLVAGGGFVCYCYMTGTRGRSRKRLAGYMRRGETRKAVKWINEAIHEQLVHKERRYNKITDSEFLMALKREFSEVEEAHWDAYFAVVRRAVYSAEEISAEEVKECYALYKVVQESSKRR